MKVNDARMFTRGLYEVPNKTRGISTRTQEDNGVTADAALQTTMGSAPSDLRLVFEGVSNEDNGDILGFRVAPPDPVGDVSPDNYFQWVNLSAEIFDKDGNSVLGPVPGNFFFQGFGGLCETTNNGDPIVLWDERAERWHISQFGFDNGFTEFYQCIAVSETSDPTGAYYRYAYDFTNIGFNDYPKLGVVTDSYTIMANLFVPPAFFFGGTFIGAFDRDAQLAGDPNAGFVGFNLGGGEFGFLPADLDGTSTMDVPALYATAMTASSSNPLFDVWEIDVDWSDPGSATASRLVRIPVTPFDNDFCFAGREACIPQPGIGSDLEAISGRLMHRLQLREIDGELRMVATHTVDVDNNRAGMRWYELRNDGGGWDLYQEGTYAPDDGLYRWMGSIAMNAAGDIALGYTSSSNTEFPAIRYTGQTADMSGTGVMNVDEVLIHQGPGAQSGTARWGDYSSMNVDPVDDSFWYTHEYSTGGNFVWNTKVANFALEGEVMDVITLDLIPPSDPVVIGPDGGSFDYGVELTNNGAMTETVDVWAKVEGPLNVFVKGPRTVTLEPGETRTATVTQDVPAGAPAGVYSYIGNAGIFGGAVTAEDAFIVEKTGASIASKGTEWTSTLADAFSEATNEVPGAYALEQNYPNPFNPTTMVAFQLPEASEVSVRVFNALGQEVATLVDGYREAGRYEVSFDATELSAGVYLYSIEAEGFRTTKQMVLLK